MLLSRCEISAYFDDVDVALKLCEYGRAGGGGGREDSTLKESEVAGRGMGGSRISLCVRMWALIGALEAGGGMSCELLASELKEEFERDVGRSLSPSMFCKPKPLDLLFSSLASCSSRCFSLFLLSAMRSLNDLIFGGSASRALPACLCDRALPARLRLTSWARRPLSMPSTTRAGLLCSSGALRARTGEAGTWTSALCRDGCL